jgi:Uma2 family endonuclease
MNATVRISQRHKITRAEYHAMWEAGVFAPDLDLELLDGELIEMAADGERTIGWNVEINRWLIQSLCAQYRVTPDKSFALSEVSEPKPDFWVFDAKLRVGEVTGANVLLVIEVSDTAVRADLGKKATPYAAGGVRDYWVVDAEKRRELVHRLGADGAYGEPTIVDEISGASALLIPDLAFRIADFPLLRS